MKNLEIIQINTVSGKLEAILSYQEFEDKTEFPNNGYKTITVPINIRKLQLSSRGNILVDQSLKEESVAISNQQL